jgi:hypothetical protein
MATVRVRIAILTVRITLSVCPFNRMAHTANRHVRCTFNGVLEGAGKTQGLLLYSQGSRSKRSHPMPDGWHVL